MSNLPERDRQGNLPKWAWPGGYPIFYITADAGVLCPGPECANGPECRDPDAERDWRLVGVDVHWEGDPLTCDHCGEAIESAYGPVEY